MKLIKVSTLPPRYWKAFYAAHPGLASRGYAEQAAAIFEDGFGWADHWRRALLPLGWDLLEWPAGVEPLDAAWKREQGLESSLNPLRTAIEAARRHHADVVWVDDHNTFTAAWIRAVREACASIRLVLGWCGAPWSDGAVFKEMDLTLSCVPEIVRELQAQGCESRHLRHAFDPRYTALALPQRDIAFSFVGQVIRGRRHHAEREALLERLVDSTPLQLFIPMDKDGVGRRLKQVARLGAWEAVRAFRALGLSQSLWGRLPGMAKAAGWEEVPVYPVNPKLARRRQGEAFGASMYKVLGRSQVTLNQHIAISAQSASNMRLFEATGMGACLLTDAKSDLAQSFEAGSEVETYASPEECEEKVRGLLADPRRARALGDAGQARVMREHTFSHRAVELQAVVEAYL